MDLMTVIASLGSSGLITVGVARWLTTKLIDHRLAKDMAEHKATVDLRVGEKLAGHKAVLDESLAVAKAELEASLRKDVEEYLGDKAADRQYRLEARKRLYTAIGPLRFQLVMASNDLAGRVQRMGNGTQPYATSLNAYFGRSTAFRLLRPFAVAELIERQMAYADFSVDPSTVLLLRFKEAAFRCMTSSTIALGHPNANWDDQVEHVFRDVLSVIAAAMIVDGDATTPPRVMRFDEFNAFAADDRWLATIDPIPSLMENFTVSAKPILWIRFIALAHLSSAFVEREGPPLGIIPEPYDGREQLKLSTDEFVNRNREGYSHMLQTLVSSIAASTA